MCSLSALALAARRSPFELKLYQGRGREGGIRERKEEYKLEVLILRGGDKEDETTEGRSKRK